jgi:hypothetical protein
MNHSVFILRHDTDDKMVSCSFVSSITITSVDDVSDKYRCRSGKGDSWSQKSRDNVSLGKAEAVKDIDSGSTLHKKLMPYTVYTNLNWLIFCFIHPLKVKSMHYTFANLGKFFDNANFYHNSAKMLMIISYTCWLIKKCMRLRSKTIR